MTIRYEDIIEALPSVDIDEIIDTATKCVPLNYKDCPWIPTDHGRKILEYDWELNCYLAAYGIMHKKKLFPALDKFPYTELNEDFEIFDWACGQGLGTVCFNERWRNSNSRGRLKKVTLIEPSAVALKRAKFNVEHACEDVSIKVLKQYLPGDDQSFDCIKQIEPTQSITIHFFSNILDIASVNLKKLAELLANTGYRSYIVCVGPVISCNNRLRQFPDWFQLDAKSMFAQYDCPQLGYLANGHSFSGEARCFKLLRTNGKPILRPIAFFPVRQFQAAYRLDSISQLAGNNYVPDIRDYSHFDVLAPFDIGAQICDDVHPILAVLNNLVTRGLPTRTSPYIEELFGKIYGITEKVQNYGTVSYPIHSEVRPYLGGEVFELMWKVPIAVARIEKVLLEAIICGRLNQDTLEWNILAKENDVPCTAIAVSELTHMFSHLTALTEDYTDYQLPNINLAIVSPRYGDSPLHLDAKVYEAPTFQMREFEWDLVLDTAIDEKSDDEHVKFSEFKAKNECWFNIRSATRIISERTIYTSDRIKYKPLTFRNEQGEYDDVVEMRQHLEYFLQMLFRKKGFRPGQLPILSQAMQLQSVIGLLPTGGGKSLTYQLAALLQPGVSIVIDPLRSLMADQYDGLLRAGIDCCTFINASVEKEEREKRETMMEYSKVLITFMSPERLCIYKFRQRLKNMQELGVYFAYGVIDEVHCVSEWGQDFRFSYLHLGRNLYQYVLPKCTEQNKESHITLFGLTATASFDVLADVERELSGNGAFPLNEDSIVRYENCNRLELQYKVERVPIRFDPDKYFMEDIEKNHINWQLPYPVDIFGMANNARESKSSFLKEYIRKIPQYLRDLQTDDSIHEIMERFNDRESNLNIDEIKLNVPIEDDFYSERDTYTQAGIVFCPHKDNTGISVNVNANKLQTFIPSVATFMGSSDNDEMDKISMNNMSRFRDDKSPLMVATKAFGMGIDKPNVRFTVNMNYSSSLESFVQEAGRAGRDRKMALAVILLSDYKLARIRRDYDGDFPIKRIRNRWFEADDLKRIINHFGLNIPQDKIDICDPSTDLVKLRCAIDNKVFGRGSCSDDMCKNFTSCRLHYVDCAYRGTWIYWNDFNDYVKQSSVHIPKESLQYLSPDYDTNMYFFDNNFKGELEEKQSMYRMLSLKDVIHFIGDSQEMKTTERSVGFLEPLLCLQENQQLVTFISYTKDESADIAKAIYRMCCIGLIDDFTQDYVHQTYRIVSTKRSSGGYYDKLKEFLMRYYSEAKADKEIEKAKFMCGENEIHRCLGYLTEFVYEKVAIKRKNALDDVRSFCMKGSDRSQNWLDMNEEMKDDLYYYFNSKFARHDYHSPSGEAFSLTDDLAGNDDIEITDVSYYYELLFKYLRVVDDDVVGSAGSPIDSVKHLRGAIRLITHRTFKTPPPVLQLLNAFCLFHLKVTSSEQLMIELQKSFSDGYLAFRELTPTKEFYDNIDIYYEKLLSSGATTKGELEIMRKWAMAAEVDDHSSWLSHFSNKFCN